MSIQDRTGFERRFALTGLPARVSAHRFFGPDDDAGSGSGDEGGSGSGDEAGGMELSKLKDQLTAANSKLGETRQQLGKANKEAQGYRESLEKFGEFKPEDLAAFKTEQDEREQKAREARGEYDQQLQVERAATAKERTDREASEKRYQGVIIDSAIVSATAGQRPLESTMKPLRKDGPPQIVTILRDEFEFDADTGRVGHVSRTNDDGSKMSPAEFVGSERTGLLSIYFETEQRSGSGTGPGRSGANGKAAPIYISRDDPHKVSKIANLRAKGDGSDKRVELVLADDPRLSASA